MSMRSAKENGAQEDARNLPLPEDPTRRCRGVFTRQTAELAGEVR
jgi:hypothetical protein